MPGCDQGTVGGGQHWAVMMVEEDQSIPILSVFFVGQSFGANSIV